MIHIVEILAGSGLRTLALCVGDTFVPTAGPSTTNRLDYKDEVYTADVYIRGSWLKCLVRILH